MPKYSTDYVLSEFFAVCSARQIKDGEVVFAGIGSPLLGAMLAKQTHAPNCVIVTECGGIGPQTDRTFLGIGDNVCIENAISNNSLWRLFADQQRGYIDIGMIGGAQVDKYGNLNSTCLFGDGDYYSPKVRFPGSGGANDIASSAGRFIVTTPLDKRRFVERVDYITSPGYIDGPDGRKKNGLPGEGPAAIITDKAIFKFDKATGEAYLDQVKSGVTVQEVIDNVGWDLKVASNVTEIEEPTVKEIEVVRILDEYKIFTGDGMSKLTFENLMQMNYRAFEKKIQSM
ncbi:MAG: CoA-transferase [Syntrophomonadaceae bacterium]|nr:CoA-transferase [Syntrophomonadaceae bacterium]